MAQATNTTTSAGLSPSMQAYYDRKLLEHAKTQFVFQQYGQKRSIPKNNGKSVQFRRWNLFTPSTTGQKLTEGVTPDGQALSMSAVTANVEQYGAYVEVSDLLDLTAIDPVISDSVELLAEQLGNVVDLITRDALAATTNVQFAGAANVADNTVAAGDKLTVAEIRKAVRTLKKNKARTFTRQGGKPHYICICDPDSTFDLQNDGLWQDVSKYSNAEQIYSGEIGRLFGVVFVETTNATVLAGAGASSIDLHATYVFGADSYGVIDIAGSGAVKSIIKPHGSAGSADPLDQRATVGAKVTAYTAKVLNDNWIIAVHHAVSA